MSLHDHRGSAWAFRELMKRTADEIASGKRLGAQRIWTHAHPKVRLSRFQWTKPLRKRA